MQRRRNTIGATAILFAVVYVCTIPTSGASFSTSEQGAVTISIEIPQKPALVVPEVTPVEETPQPEPVSPIPEEGLVTSEKVSE